MGRIMPLLMFVVLSVGLGFFCLKVTTKRFLEESSHSHVDIADIPKTILSMEIAVMGFCFLGAALWALLGP